MKKNKIFGYVLIIGVIIGLCSGGSFLFLNYHPHADLLNFWSGIIGSMLGIIGAYLVARWEMSEKKKSEQVDKFRELYTDFDYFIDTDFDYLRSQIMANATLFKPMELNDFYKIFNAYERKIENINYYLNYYDSLNRVNYDDLPLSLDNYDEEIALKNISSLVHKEVWNNIFSDDDIEVKSKSGLDCPFNISVPLRQMICGKIYTNYEDEDNKIVAWDTDGTPIYDETNPMYDSLCSAQINRVKNKLKSEFL